MSQNISQKLTDVGSLTMPRVHTMRCEWTLISPIMPDRWISAHLHQLNLLIGR
eukprot:SAG31_NODE_45031_length_260_cov_0.956522_1_plen_52_part_10